MSTIARGVTFSDSVGATSHTATSDNLFSLVASAVLTDALASEFDDEDLVLRTDTTFPSAAQDEGEFWHDSTLGIVRSREGQRWDGKYDYLQVVNGQNSALTLGSVVYFSDILGGGIPQVLPAFSAPSATSPAQYVAGVVLANIAANSTGLIVNRGFHRVLIKGPVTIGDYVQASSGMTGIAKALQWTAGISGTDHVFLRSFGRAFYNLTDTSVTTMTCFLY